jgi:hypothetical protein
MSKKRKLIILQLIYNKWSQNEKNAFEKLLKADFHGAII